MLRHELFIRESKPDRSLSTRSRTTRFREEAEDGPAPAMADDESRLNRRARFPPSPRLRHRPPIPRAGQSDGVASRRRSHRRSYCLRPRASASRSSITADNGEQSLGVLEHQLVARPPDAGARSPRPKRSTPAETPWKMSQLRPTTSRVPMRSAKSRSRPTGACRGRPAMVKADDVTAKIKGPPVGGPSLWWRRRGIEPLVQSDSSRDQLQA